MLCNSDKKYAFANKHFNEKNLAVIVKFFF